MRSTGIITGPPFSFFLCLSGVYFLLYNLTFRPYYLLRGSHKGFSMLANFVFKPAPSLVFGSGTLCKVPNLLESYGQQLLILVGGNSFLSGKYWPELRKKLESHGFSYSIEQINGEPSPEDIDSLCQAYSEETINAVLAIGGGSVLDAGKAVAAILVEQQPITTFLEGVGTQKPSGKKVPFLAIPTTSGTGSEATSNAVISKVGENGFKKSLRHDNYVPNIAIIDPALTVNCPVPLTVACGMDSFTQLVEAYLSTHASPLSDTLALEGIRCIIRSLEKACKDGNDLEARTDMSYAAYLSGLVLANAGLGAVHGFASAIGGYFTIPHGVVCGTLMAPANRITLHKLRHTGENELALHKYTTLGHMLNSQLDEQEAQDAFISYLDNLTKILAIPPLSDFSISHGDIPKILGISENKNNPAQLSSTDLTSILQTRIL